MPNCRFLTKLLFLVVALLSILLEVGGFSVQTAFKVRLWRQTVSISAPLSLSSNKLYLQPQADMRLLDTFRRKPFESFLGKSIKYVIASLVTLSLLLSDSPVPLYYASISVLNSTLGKVLKQLIRQPRPLSARKASYGMPSTHTQAASFFCVVLFYKLHTVLPNKGRLCFLLNVAASIYTILAW
jgi:membrane-associated phospholipid phosphatase